MKDKDSDHKFDVVDDEKEEDLYEDDDLEELKEEDEISEAEEGFMKGYNDASGSKKEKK